MNLVIKDDIPACLSFLEAPIGQFGKYYDEWEEYTDSIDHKDLKEKLQHLEFYSFPNK